MRSVPSGWARRLSVVGRVGVSATRAVAGRMVGLVDADRRFGEQLAGELDQLKGMAMKVGQILSYMDVMPPEAAAAMAKLQEGATPLDLDTLTPLVEQALGMPLDQAFDQFDPRPIAAASIGQVHRATLRGQALAVKVQYPGVAQVLRDDFQQLHRLSQLAALGTRVDGPALADELRARLLEECDYSREAQMQHAFSQAWASTPALRIPEVILERCAPTVLTTAWAEGISFEAACRLYSAAQRQQAATTLLRFSYGSLMRLGAIQADPHPGNTRFAPDAVIFLDFGCVKTFERSVVTAFRDLSLAVIDGRRADFPALLVATGMAPAQGRFDFDHHWELLRLLYAPFTAPRYSFQTGWLRPALEAQGPSNPNARTMSLPPAWLWIHRLQWGLGAVLGRLGAEGDFASVFRECMESPWTPLESADAPRL